MATKNKGRPTIYSKELTETICLRISNGRSLRDVCSDSDIPTMSTVMKWLSKNNDFSEQYRVATDNRHDFHFEEMLDIADNVIPDTAEIAKARLKIDTRKWMLSRMNPKKYSDKQSIEHTGPNGGAIDLSLKVVFEDDGETSTK